MDKFIKEINGQFVVALPLLGKPATELEIAKKLNEDIKIIRQLKEGKFNGTTPIKL